MQQLFQVPEEVINAVAQERILKGLRYEGIRCLNERHDMICEAHSKTFEWLVSEREKTYTESETPRSDHGLSLLTAYPRTLDSSALLGVDRGELSDDEDDILAEFGDWRQFHNPQNHILGSHTQSPVILDSRNDVEARHSARELFREWLSSGEGIFHFSAKLGAGKSTLMKLICSNEHVKSMLQA